jgi:acyl carrier protein
MLLERVEELLASMDIQEVAPHKLLGDDLAMDSQELVCAAADMEKAFAVKLDDGELHRDMSVLDVVRIISCKLADKVTLGDFTERLSEDTAIAVPIACVYQNLYEVESWPNKLPHVRHVTTRYDDGRFQEFDMEVDGGEGGAISVRSVRCCEPGRIRFFQPSPPRFVRHHCGDWILTSLSRDITHVVTRHRWRLADAAPELFLDRAGVGTAEQIKAWLAGHARFALQCWKSCLETGAAQ